MKFIQLFFAILLFLFAAQPAWAINCMSEDTDKIKILYKAYLDSGQLPTAKLESDKKLGTNGINVIGTITGITRFETCWNNKPPCATPAEYASAQINFITSAQELRKVYGSNGNNGLIDCFQKLGLAAHSKKSSSFINNVLR